MSGGTVILGAGPTGLGAAYRLVERGEKDFEIFERSGQVGGLWIAPDALARLNAGDVLDHDPETQIDTSVEAVQPTDSGFTVTIRETGAVEVSDLVYDGETGLLVRWSTSNLQLNTRYDYSISSWS